MKLKDKRFVIFEGTMSCFIFIGNQLTFTCLSVKKSSANDIRNTEKIYNFVIVGYCLYFAIKLQSSLVI